MGARVAKHRGGGGQRGWICASLCPCTFRFRDTLRKGGKRKRKADPLQAPPAALAPPAPGPLPPGVRRPRPSGRSKAFGRQGPTQCWSAGPSPSLQSRGQDTAPGFPPTHLSPPGAFPPDCQSFATAPPHRARGPAPSRRGPAPTSLQVTRLPRKLGSGSALVPPSAPPPWASAGAHNPNL